jgi:hypothetical protein
MDTIRVARNREVVVTKTVVDSYEYPAINLCSGEVRVEVFPDRQVAIDGVLIKGSRLVAKELLGWKPGHIQGIECKVELPNSLGYIVIRACTLLYLDGNMPMSAKLVEKGE